jgi:type I restriction enzyme S subunit
LGEIKIPEGWTMRQLKEFCSFAQGGRLGFIKQVHYRTSGVPAYSAAGQDGFVEVAEFRNTDAVVLSAIGANCGRCFRAHGEWTTLANVQAIIPDVGAADARFLHYRVNRDDYWPRSGSAQPFIKPSDMKACWIALPPFPQQTAIAKVIDTLDTAIHETEAIIAKLQAVKQGLLHDLLTRGIDANGEMRPSRVNAPHLYKRSPLGWIPIEWELSTIVKQFEIQLGKMLDGQKNSGVLKPYVGNKAVQWDRIDIGEVQQVRLSQSDLVRFRLQKGDLLVCEGGEVGRAAIWNDEISECYYQKALHRLRPLQGYHPRLMLEILRYLLGRDALSEYISKTSIAHLTQEKLATVPLLVPKADEQKRLVAIILADKRRQEAEESQVQKLKLLKSGLLNDLLTGHVRVTPLLRIWSTISSAFGRQS